MCLLLTAFMPLGVTAIISQATIEFHQMPRSSSQRRYRCPVYRLILKTVHFAIFLYQLLNPTL